jgi:acyl-CoA dehydrogenase
LNWGFEFESGLFVMTLHSLKRPEPAASSDLAAPAHGVEDIQIRARRVAQVAAAHAQAVDREGRFPAEAIAAAKAEGLMGVLAPAALGGEGASFGQVTEVCHALGQACSSTAMIYAMHQIKAACVIRHAGDSVWHQQFIRRLVAEQLLLASSTTEGKAGGDVRNSAAAVSQRQDRITLDRDASVISYGQEADGIVTTARRDETAATSDQVLLVLLKSDYSLTHTQSWDTLGMRGTQSRGFALKADADRAQIMPVAYDLIHSQTMVPTAHLFWSGVWSGIAAASVERARRFIRKTARGSGGQLPPAAAYLTKANTSLRALRALIAAALARYEALDGDAEALGGLEFQTSINLLKVDASELAVATVMSAMRACGLSGYRNDSEASLGRQLRDVLSAPIMINNDRILSNLAASSLMAETPLTLFS